MNPDASVWPKTTANSTPSIASMWRTSSAGTTAPPLLTARSDDRSRRPKSGWPTTASNMVGTPQVSVADSASISSSTRPGSKAGTRTAVAACWQSWNDTTCPPTWNKGMVCT